MISLSKLNRPKSYPLIMAFVMGVLVSGVTYRFTTDVPSRGSGTSGSNTAGSSTPGAGLPGPASTGTQSPGTTTGGSIVAPGSTGGSATGGTSGTPVSTGGHTATSSAGTGGSNAPAALTASDVGVTSTSIKVGIALLNIGQAAEFVAIPGTDPKEQRKIWQAMIDQLNRSGGILGRKLIPYYQTVDVTDDQAQQAACRTWTQTDHVFAVFSGGALQGAGQLCVAAENRTLLIAGATAYSPEQNYREARGLLISQAPNATREFADWARSLQHLGLLKGHKLGLIVDQGDGETVAKEGLVPALRAMGYQITYTAVISGDASTAATQVSNAAVQMQRAGVDTVLVAVPFVATAAFVNQADKQQWKPQYLVNSWDGNDLATFYAGMPKSWDGAIAVSYYPQSVKTRPERPIQRACRDRYNKQTRANMQPDDDYIAIAVTACNGLDLLAKAGQIVGPDLTRARVSAAVQGLGTSFTFDGMGGSFGHGKTDYNNVVRPLVWGPPDGSEDTNCLSDNSRCWNARGPAFNPAR